jgi:hypothetical protein
MKQVANKLCCLFVWLALQVWRWKRHVSLRRFTFSGPHIIIFKKIELFIAIAVRTSDPSPLEYLVTSS